MIKDIPFAFELPWGSARSRVRGLAASRRRSAIRFIPMAPLRAPTIATRIHQSFSAEGILPAARIAPIKANGSAKIVWENRIISR